MPFSLDTLIECLSIHFGCVDRHPGYYHRHLKMFFVNIVHGCIVKMSLCFVPDTLNCADNNDEKRDVIVNGVSFLANVHIKDDTVFYTTTDYR